MNILVQPQSPTRSSHRPVVITGLIVMLMTVALAVAGPAADAATPAQSAASSNQAALLNQMVALTNQERQRAGCRPLARDARAERAAQKHAEWMNRTGTFSHRGANNTRFVERMRAEGHPRPGGENIAYGQKTAQRVVTAWMNSSGHRANILNCRFTNIGVGLAGTRPYWVQNFGY